MDGGGRSTLEYTCLTSNYHSSCLDINVISENCLEACWEQSYMVWSLKELENYSSLLPKDFESYEFTSSSIKGKKVGGGVVCSSVSSSKEYKYHRGGCSQIC